MIAQLRRNAAYLHLWQAFLAALWLSGWAR
jgi:hypothetical protein